MNKELARELISAGVHFGHAASRWNPKMRPYIYGRRNLIHIINVKETLRGILWFAASSRRCRFRNLCRPIRTRRSPRR
mgnify:CR=1 FL=1